MPILKRMNTAIYRTYGLARRRARPIVVFTIIFLGRSQLLRRAGVHLLTPFPTLTQRIRGLAAARSSLPELEIIPVDPDCLVSSLDSLSEIAIPSVRLGSNAALLRHRIDMTLAPILASRG